MVPIRAIFFVCVFDILLQCIALTGNGLTAFYSITGLTTVGFQVSYAIPVGLMVLVLSLKCLKIYDFQLLFYSAESRVQPDRLSEDSIKSRLTILSPGDNQLLLALRDLSHHVSADGLSSDYRQYELAVCSIFHRIFYRSR